MSAKVIFFICLSGCFIGSVFCNTYLQLNPAPYLIKKQYYLSDPGERRTLEEAKLKCRELGLTLGTVDNIQEREILLDQIRRDYNRYALIGSSQFWLEPVFQQVLPGPPGFVLMPPRLYANHCVKARYFPTNVEFLPEDCESKYRFICAERAYEPRSLLSRLKKKIKSAFSHAGHIIKWVKAKLLKTSAFTASEVNKLLDAITEDIKDSELIDYDEKTICPDAAEADSLTVLEDCTKAIAKNLRKKFFMKQVTPSILATSAANSLKNKLKSIISKIQSVLNWSKEKARKAIRKVIQTLEEPGEDYSHLY